MRIKFTTRLGSTSIDGEVHSYTLADYVTDYYPFIQLVPGDPLVTFRIPADHDARCPQGCFTSHTKVVSPYEVTSGRHPSELGLIAANLVKWEVLDPLWENKQMSYHYGPVKPDDWTDAPWTVCWECTSGNHDGCTGDADIICTCAALHAYA